MKLDKSILAAVAMMIGSIGAIGCSTADAAADEASADEPQAAAAQPATASAPRTAAQSAPIAPPVARAEQPGAAPFANAYFTPGYWSYRSTRFEWVSGRWDKRREGCDYVSARWEKRGARYAFVPGHWNGPRNNDQDRHARGDDDRKDHRGHGKGLEPKADKPAPKDRNNGHFNPAKRPHAAAPANRLQITKILALVKDKAS